MGNNITLPLDEPGFSALWEQYVALNPTIRLTQIRPLPGVGVVANIIGNDESGIATMTTVDAKDKFRCHICFLPCADRLPIVTRCGHLFCRDCIANVIATHAQCPMCSATLDHSDLRRAYV